MTAPGERLRFGLCGGGDFGLALARYLSEVADVTAACDPSPAARERLRAALPDAALFASHDELLSQAPVDAVAIATPNGTHRAITLAAAAAGRHVFCEKPMATTVADCRAMTAACDAAGVRLMVGHKRRLRPPWARMIELRERLGPVAAASVTLWFDARPYDHRGWLTRRDACGGTLFLSGVHTVDWLHAMCGPVARVRAVAGPQIDPRYEFADVVHVTLEHRAGAVATLDVAFGFPLDRFREAVGPTVLCRDGGMRLHAGVDRIELEHRHRDDAATTWERFDDLGFDVAYRRELSDFVAWVRSGREPCLTAAEGLHAVETMEAAERSLARDGAIVALPL